MLETFKRTQKPAGANAIERISRGIMAFVTLTVALAAADAPPPTHGISDGETLVYSVRWGFIPSVGRIRISAQKVGVEPDAVLKVSTVTGTWGLARGLFAFDGRGESIYQLPSGLLLSVAESSSYRNRSVKNSVSFDYGKMTASYVDELHPKNSKVLKMPDGDPSDLILALIQTRYWNLKPGESRDTLVIFEDQFYPLTVRAEPDPEFVITSLGIFKATILVPRMEKSPPIGMFKRGSTVRVWIANEDPRHLPVRFEVGFRFGTGTATLLDYTGPK
jgi:hypothetical protein